MLAGRLASNEFSIHKAISYAPHYALALDSEEGWCNRISSHMEIGVEALNKTSLKEAELLSPELSYYILKEKWWDWGSGEILNQNGSPVGKMHRRVVSLRALTEITDLEGTQVLTVNKKLVSIRSSYMIKDAGGQLLGRTNRKILTLFRPKLWLEDSEGRKLLEAKGNFLGKSFELKGIDGKVKAKVGKGDFFKDLVLGGLFDFSDTYAIQVLDPDYDKRLLLGFVVAIDNSVHDE